MKKNYLSIVAIVMSTIAMVLSIISFIMVKASFFADKPVISANNSNYQSQESVATHPFPQDLIGTWSDTEWLLTIMPDSSVYIEQLDYENRTKDYLLFAPRLYIGYIENNAIMISYKTDSSYEEYSANPEGVSKEAYNVTVTLRREGTDSFRLESLVSQNGNYSFRRNN